MKNNIKAFTPQVSFEKSEKEKEYDTFRSRFPEAFGDSSAESAYFKENPLVISTVLAVGVTIEDIFNDPLKYCLPDCGSFRKFDVLDIINDVRKLKTESHFIFDLKESLANVEGLNREACCDPDSFTFKYAVWCMLRNQLLMRLYESLRISFFDFTSFIQLNQLQNTVQLTLQFAGDVPQGHFHRPEKQLSTATPLSRYLRNLFRKIEGELSVINMSDSLTQVYNIRAFTVISPNALNPNQNAVQHEKEPSVSKK